MIYSEKKYVDETDVFQVNRPKKNTGNTKEKAVNNCLKKFTVSMGCRVQKMVSSKDADFVLSLDGQLFSWGKNIDLIQRPEIKDKSDSDVPGQSIIYVSRRLKEIMDD